MTTRQLSFKGPPQLALAAGATTPNPGIFGVQVWSTTTNSILMWDGSTWSTLGSGEPPTTLSYSLSNPPDANVPKGQIWTPATYSSGGFSATANMSTSGTSSFTEAGGTLGSYNSTHSYHSFTGVGATYTCKGVYGTGAPFRRGTAENGGFIFNASVDFQSVPFGCSGYAAILDAEGLFSGWGDTTYIGVGVGFDTTDSGNSLFLMVGNGTTKTRTALTRTGSGYVASSGRKFRLMIVCLPGATNATVDMIDLSNSYPVLDKVSVDISSISANLGLNINVCAATDSSTDVVNVNVYEAYGIQYPVVPKVANVIVSTDTTGNAATATQLAASRTIQGVAFNGSANIDVISIGSVAPSSPTLNQLWIETT